MKEYLECKHCRYKNLLSIWWRSMGDDDTKYIQCGGCKKIILINKLDNELLYFIKEN